MTHTLICLYLSFNLYFSLPRPADVYFAQIGHYLYLVVFIFLLFYISKTGGFGKFVILAQHWLIQHALPKLWRDRMREGGQERGHISCGVDFPLTLIIDESRRCKAHGAGCRDLARDFLLVQHTIH